MRNLEIGEMVTLRGKSMPQFTYDTKPHFVRTYSGEIPVVGVLKPEDIKAIGEACKRLSDDGLGDEEKLMAKLNEINSYDFLSAYKYFLNSLIDEEGLTDSQCKELRFGLDGYVRNLSLRSLPNRRFEEERVALGETELFPVVTRCPFEGYARRWDRVARKVREERGVKLDPQTEKF